MMSDKLDWTKNLGDAVLAQQPDVMDAIQRLRSKAYDNKKLVTTKQQKVSVQTQESKQVIVIEPADPDTMYVPYYDPATVYGAWPYADYPPYYFGYPSYIGAGVIAAGLAFGTAWAIGRWGNYWGGGCNWGNRNVYVNHSTDHQHRKQLAAQCGASPGRAIQQRQRSAALRQQQSEGRRREPDGFPRPRRAAGASSGTGPTGRWRSRR